VSDQLARVIRHARRLQRRAAQISADIVNRVDLGLGDQAFDIHPSAEFRTPQQIALGDACVIKERVILNGRSQLRRNGITLGADCYIKEGCILDAYGGYIAVAGPCAIGQNTIMHGGGGIEIGAHVIMGANCYLIASNHQYGSTELPIMLQGDHRRGISVGNNVWLGGGVTVLDGVAIGDNVVVGAGTVLAKSVHDNSVVFNNRTLDQRGIF
jgi:acetyltransferase-like isoleucine patch superfamily enzyme